jgi:putative ABC transport system permease protein
MLASYFKIALRALWKNRLYSFINIIGLSLGITVSVMILFFIVHELSYDRFHANESRIVKMHATIKWGEQSINATSMSAPFGPLLAASSSNIVSYVRLREPSRVVIHSDTHHKFFEDRFIFADSSFFSVFSFQLLEGSSKSLGEAKKVFITPAVQQKYFGSISAIGKFLTYQNGTELEVAGIVAPPPSNSSLKFDFIASFPTLGILPDKNEKAQYDHDKASLGSYPTYFLLQNPLQVKELEASIPKIAQTSANETYTLSPLRDKPSNLSYLKIFGSVASLVLLLALVNYMNLTTARGTTRAKEVGVRKVIGANRRSISAQFYMESSLLTAISFGLAYIFLLMLLPSFQQVVGLRMDAGFLTSSVFLSLIATLLVLCIFFAGSYPALVLSGFNPIAVLSGKSTHSQGRGSLIRKSLTIFQFTISGALIICSLIIQQQLEFMRDMNIGINKDHVLVVNLEGLGASYLPFRHEVEAMHDVSGVAQASVSLFNDNGMAGFFLQTPKTKEDVFINVMTVDPDFFRILAIEWDARTGDTLRSGDYVINEAALAKLKIEKRDVHQPLKLFGDTATIAGIVKDFNYASLKEPIGGLIMNVSDHNITAPMLDDKGSIYIRMNTGSNIDDRINNIRLLFEKYQPTAPFEYYFLDDAFQNQYAAEQRLTTIFKVFTILAIVIACMGLFGLVTFATERKTKEIGIRKVLGASVQSILSLVTREFLGIVFVSLLLAVPLAWWAMDWWLSNFSYRISISLYVFVASGVCILILSLITISIQAAKAASVNPVNSLRNE